MDEDSRIIDLLFDSNEKVNYEVLDCFGRIFKIKENIYYYSKKLQKLIEIGKNVNTNNKKLIYHIGLDNPNLIEKGALKNKNLLNIAEVENKIDKVVRKTDLFASTPCRKKEGNILEIIDNKIHFKNIKLDSDIDYELYNAVVSDYKQHFYELDEVLDFIVACRFSSNRRNSFLHLRVNAGWGKTFFLTMLKELGLLLELNYNDFKDPCGLNVEDFSNKIIIGIDEFTHFKQEFKRITNTLQLTPKFGFKAEVDVYAKLFLSAERSKSFENAVTKQIIDRVNIIDKKTTLQLENRELFKKYGIYYRDIVKHYINTYIQKQFDNYIALGKLKADRKAYDVLENFGKKHILKATEIEEYLKEAILNKVYEFIKEQESSLDEHQHRYLRSDDEYVYIINPSQFFKYDILEDEDEHLQRSAKFLSINAILDKETQRRRLKGELKSFIQFEKSYVKDFITNKNGEKENNKVEDYELDDEARNIWNYCEVEEETVDNSEDTTDDEEIPF